MKDVTALELEKAYFYTETMIKNTFEWARANGKAFTHPINKEEYCTVPVSWLRKNLTEAGQSEAHDARAHLQDHLFVGKLQGKQ